MDSISIERRCQGLRSELEDTFERKLSRGQWTAVRQTDWFARWCDGDVDLDDVRGEAATFLRQIRVVPPVEDVAVQRPYELRKATRLVDWAVSHLVAWEVEDQYRHHLARIRSWFGPGALTHEEMCGRLAEMSEEEARELGGKPELNMSHGWFENKARRLAERLEAEGQSLFAVNEIWDLRSQQSIEENLGYELHKDQYEWPFGIPAVTRLHRPPNPLHCEHTYWWVYVYKKWGRLAEIGSLAEHLRKAFHWYLNDLLPFIIRGEIPYVPQVSAHMAWEIGEDQWWHPAVSGAVHPGRPSRVERIRMEIDPTAAPNDVGEEYSYIRRGRADIRFHKELSNKHAALAVFAFDPERADMGWADRMAAWNDLRAKQPLEGFTGKQTYDEVPRFKHHCKVARERLLNPRSGKDPKDEDDDG